MTAQQPLPKPVLDKANELARLARELGMDAAVVIGSGIYTPVISVEVFGPRAERKETTNDRDE